MVDLADKHSPLARFFAKVGAIALGVALLGAGARFAYVTFFPDILVNKARSSLAKGDLRNAALAAKRAYQIRNSDVDAMRLMADIADQCGEYVALDWRKKVVESMPDSLSDILALANTALHCGQAQLAKETLAKAGKPRGNARYWAIRASTDEYLGDLSDAEREAEEATRLDPGNKDYQLSRAAIQLKTRHLEVRDEARSTLEALTKEPRLRIAAERLLVEDSIANCELSAAVKLGKIVVSEKDSQFYDKLTYLTILNRSGNEKFHTYLEALQTSARASPSDAGALIAWMLNAGLNPQAFKWVKSLPRSVTCTAEAGPFVALCYIDAARWQELHDLIKDGSWGRSDYLRCAFLAHTAEMLGNGIEFQQASNKSMDEAASDSHAERTLGEIELDWGWEGEAEHTLWDFVDKFGSAESLNWALPHLYSIYAKRQNVDQLAVITQKMAELRPEDDLVRNNFVMFSLLTRKNLFTVLPLAEALYKRHSTNRVYVSTYAYSLLVHGDGTQAMKVIMSLSDEDKRSPSVAPYCGIILAANKKKEMAKAYLNLVDETKLLPQEVILVDTARNQTR